MSVWGSAKARRVLAALLRIGWSIKREVRGSHRILARPGWPDYVFSFHEGEEIGPRHARADSQAHRIEAGESLGRVVLYRLLLFSDFCRRSDLRK